LISPELEERDEFEIKEGEQLVERRPAVKHSMSEIETEEENAPAKKRPCIPKQPPVAAVPYSQENTELVEKFHFVGFW
jgi:hypothetical protein